MIMSSYKIRQFIYEIKREWRKRAVRQGCAMVVITSLSFFAVFLLLETLFDLSPFLRGLGIFIASVTVLYILIRFLIWPAVKRLDDRKIALYVEEQLPDLEDRLNSAVEVNKGYIKRGENIIVEQLIEGAVNKTRIIDYSTVVNRKKERILSTISNILLVLFLIFLIFFFNSIRNVAGQLDVSLNPVSEFDEKFMNISPGDIQIEKGGSQEIIAEMKGDTDEDIILHYKMGEEIWRKQSMEKGIKGSNYIHQFSDIQEPIHYYVEFNENQSSEYTISIYEFPKVTKIDLETIYPEYTGIPSKTEENTGDINGLCGSDVSLTIETNGSAVSGEMVIDDSVTIQLQSLDKGRFSTSISLMDTAFYHIRLTDVQHKNNKYPEEYQIIPVEDEKPIIYITDPQRDMRVNMVEEVLLAATVTDDYGVRDVHVKFSINGEDEKTETMLNSKSMGEQTVKGSYVFFLEDYNLKAGDVISYYVEADDNCPSNDIEYSDMYFIEVTSLDNRYTQMSNRGGAGGGGGGQSADVVNQQKIIAATWKLERTKKEIPERKFDESLDAISRAQKVLKEDVEGQVNSSKFSPEMLNEETKSYIEYLERATKEMDEALDKLSSTDLKNAVKEEQQALNYLLKAEALDKDKRVQLQRGGAGGSGGSSQERMQELEDLELDISKEKYEMQQQRQQEQQNKDVDETLEKVKELARRQEKLAARSQRELQEEEEKRFLDRLKRDQEQLRRDGEALAGEMRNRSRENQQLSRQMQQQMQRILQDMRRAEEALNKNNPEEALSQQQAAINELDRLEQDLRMSQADNYREMTKNFIDQFEGFKEQEQNFEKDLEQTYEDSWNNPQRKIKISDIERLASKRDDDVADLQNIEQKAEAIEEITRREDPEISTILRNFRRNLEREELEANIKTSKRAIQQGWLSYAKAKESEIRSSIERLEGQIRQLEDKLPMTEEERLNRSLKDVRELLRKYDEITDAARQQIDPPKDEAMQGGERLGRESQEQSNPQQDDPERAQRAEITRLQRQIEQMERQLDNIRRGGGDANMRSTLESVRNDVGRLHNTGVLLDEAGLEYFKKKVYNPLSRLEFRLVEKLDEIEMDRKLHGGRKADVPAQYRKMVEKYYETISKTSKQRK